ncbi:MAG: hypothetical protein JST39_25530, partial [Bacteroidetes bacterium]|nr:hypothetical protein [Bacteroidota bacterium]
REYKALIVIEVETMHPATAKALQRYAEAGGRIIFIEKYPHKAPGYFQHEGPDQQVKESMAAITKLKNVALHPAPVPEGRIIDWYRDLQNKHGLKPDMKIDHPEVMVSQVHYRGDRTDAFFINNFSSTERYSFTAEFEVPAGRTAWLWDPETGQRFLYPVAEKKNRLDITLGPAETRLIVFDEQKKGRSYIALRKPLNGLIAVDKPWTLTLHHYNGTERTMQLDKLVDFSADTGLAGFAGAAVYQNDFTVKEPAQIKTLDLGRVEGITEVTLNGVSLGNRWYGDHLYDVSKVIKTGKNNLSIRLVTTLGNYMMTSLKENKDTVKWLVKKKQPLYPQGILGPVMLG